VLEVEDPSGFDLNKFYVYCQKEIPSYALPGFIRLIPELPRTDTRKVRKPALMYDFIERTPKKDADEQDLLYVIVQGKIKAFNTQEYQREMAKCTDPAVRARFQAVTRRQDIF